MSGLFELVGLSVSLHRHYARCFFFFFLQQALTLSDEFKEGKLLAYRLLVLTTFRHTDIPLPAEHLCRVYRILHHGLVHADQDTINVLVRYCGSRFFSMPLPGSTMLMLDFVHAANTIAANTDLMDTQQVRGTVQRCGILHW